MADEVPPAPDEDISPQLAAAMEIVVERLSALPPVPMPPDVWARLEAALQQEAAKADPRVGAVPDGVVPEGVLAEDADNVVPLRRRRRWIPATLAAAAAVVAAGLVLPNLNPEPGPVADGAPGGQALSAPPGGAGGATIDALPAHYVVASGTDYSQEELPAQVTRVLGSVGMAGPERVVAQASLRTVPASTPAPVGSDGMTSDYQDLHDCLAALAGGGDKPPALVVDRARYLGEDAAVVVMVHDVQTEPMRASLHVVVIRPDCSAADRAQARRMTFDLAAS